MTMNPSASIQVQPDSNGNLTITIKLIIAGIASAKIEEEITTEEVAPAVQDVQDVPGSPDLLASDSSDESTDLQQQQAEASTGNNNPRPYSLRSRVSRIDDDDDEDTYEIDYELSQQVNRFSFR